MQNTAAHPPRIRRGRYLLPIALFLAAGAASAGAFSMAIFTDQAAVTSNAFDTGTVDLAASPSSAAFTVVDMMPGDTVNASLTITNSGTSALRYSMTSASTNTDNKNLRDVITLTVKTQGTSCAAFDGTTLYSGALGSAAFGSNAPGGQTGDRTLAATNSEVLCFRAALPSATGDAYQNAATTTTFTFDGEQTVNNP